MVFLDSDIFLLEFIFQRDPRHGVNQHFLSVVQDHSPAITIYNLMEILGQLSFNLPQADWRNGSFGYKMPTG